MSTRLPPRRPQALPPAPWAPGARTRLHGCAGRHPRHIASALPPSCPLVSLLSVGRRRPVHTAVCRPKRAGLCLVTARHRDTGAAAGTSGLTCWLAPPHLKLSAISIRGPGTPGPPTPYLSLAVALPRGLSGGLLCEHRILFESSLGTLAGVKFEQNAILSGHHYLSKVPPGQQLGRAPLCGSVCRDPTGPRDPGRLGCSQQWGWGRPWSQPGLRARPLFGVCFRGCVWGVVLGAREEEA